MREEKDLLNTITGTRMDKNWLISKAREMELLSNREQEGKSDLGR